MTKANETIQLPLELIANGPGFTFDIGASVAKIIYRSKTEFQKGQPLHDVKSALGSLTTKKLPCEDLDGVISLINTDCDITRGSEEREVIVTGVGANRNKEKLEKELNCRLQVVSEFDTLIDGIILLLKTNQDPYLPLSKEPRDVAIERFVRFQNFLEGYKDQSRAKWVKKQDIEESLSWQPDANTTFPFLVVSCGSITVFHKVYVDGSYENLDVSEIGGKFVLALLAQLTKEKDFEKLLGMSSTSDGRSVDLYASDLTNKDPSPGGSGEKDSADDPYKKFNHDSIIFPFGKAYQNDDVKPGDVVFSILNIVSNNLCQVAHQLATIHNCPHVVFNGNFVSSLAIRDWLTRDMTLRNLRVSKERRVRFNFLRHGGFLVGLGALVAQEKLEKSSQK